MDRALQAEDHAVEGGAGVEHAIQEDTDTRLDGELWEKPRPFKLYSLPEWPQDVFPEPVQSFIVAEAEATETPIELATMIVLAVLATAAQRSYRVQVKPDYSESLSLWTITILPSGSRKSSVLSAAMEPLLAWEMAQRVALGPRVRKLESERKILEKRLDSLRKRAADAQTSDQYEQLVLQIEHIESEFPHVPRLPRLWTRDSTSESLIALLAEHGECMAILADEGGIIDTVSGRYNRGVPNLDVLLAGHNAEPYNMDRVGREQPLHLEAPRLSIGLCVQPDVLEAMHKKPMLRERGFLARVLFSLPVSNLGCRTGRTLPVPEQVRDHYAKIVLSILEQPSQENGTAERQRFHTLRINEDAFQIWESFWQAVEKEIAEGGKFASLTDWAGKLPGAAARIAGIFHVARHAEGKPQEYLVNAHDMRAAVRLCGALMDHALVAFNKVMNDPVCEEARAILEWCKRTGKCAFTLRDVQNGMGTRFKTRADLDAPIALLEARGYVRPSRVKRGEGRPSEVFLVNPALYAPLSSKQCAEGSPAGSNHSEDDCSVPQGPQSAEGGANTVGFDHAPQDSAEDIAERRQEHGNPQRPPKYTPNTQPPEQNEHSFSQGYQQMSRGF